MGIYSDLKDKVAIVTGSGRPSGIGEEIAKRLAAEGCKVVITDIGAAKGPEFPEGAVGVSTEMEAIAQSIRAAGGEATTCVCDMREASQIENLVDTTVSVYGSLDIMVNNAGVGYLMKPIIEMNDDEWDAVIDVNLRGTFLGIKYAARQMIKQGGGGKIVNIGSQASKSAFPHAAAYTSSKHGLVGLTRVAAIELGAHKINVNMLCPNHITTALGDWQNKYFHKIVGSDSVEDYLSAMSKRIPMGRPGLQEDIAKACAFLCSEQSVYMTAESMNVSGGEEYH